MEWGAGDLKKKKKDRIRSGRRYDKRKRSE
jgi:hypothetical protein